MKKNERIFRNNRKGQSTAEYLILFSVIIAAVVVGVTTFIGPSVEELYRKSGDVINAINPTLIDGN